MMDAQCDRRAQVAMIAAGVLGFGAFGFGLAAAPERAWAGLTVGNVLALSLAMGATLFVALNHVFAAGWAVVFRRVPEAMAAYLPMGSVVLLAGFLVGGRHLYPWMRPEVMAADAHIRHKQALLNPAAFVIVTVATFAIWIVYATVARNRSRAQDRDSDVRHTRFNQRWSAGFLVLSGLAIIPASFVWLMSLEPRWTSTMYPAYVYASFLTGGCACMALLVVLMSRRGVIGSITESHVYELTRLVGAACTLWVYIWFSQYMLIYYTNIPEESIYYAVRRSGPFGALFLVNVVLNWLAPMLMMLTDRARRSATVLVRICITLLAGRWLDTVLLITPAVATPFRLAPYDVLIPLGFVPLFVLALRAAFRSARPMPEGDPYLVESRGLAS